MDIIDKASKAEAEFLRKSLTSQLTGSQKDGVSMKECIDCGERIPEARRQAASGCLRCVECQEDFEGVL